MGQPKTRGICRTEPGSTIEALLLTHMRREERGPTIAASFFTCSQRARLCLYELWECASARGCLYMKVGLKFEPISGAERLRKQG